MEKVKLKDICRLINGRAYKQEELLDSGKYPVLRVGNFFSDKVFYYSDLELEEDKYCDNGDLLFAWSASFGPKIWDGEKVIYHYHIWKMELTDRVNKEFLFYYLFHLSERIKSEGHGGIMIHTTKAEMEEREFNLPTLEEQIAISEILNKVMSVIDKRKEELSVLDDLIKARFVEMFGDAVANPMNWPIKELKDLSVQINSGNTPKGGSENYVEEGIAFFRSQNVWKDCLKMDDIAYIDEETHAKMKRSSLKQGDILMTKTGRINTENSSLGRAALYMGEDDMANVNGHVYFIRLKPEVNNKFVLRILVSDEYRDLIRSVCVGGIDKRQLNKEHIEDFPIICPPDYMVDKYVSFVEQVDKSKVAVQKALDETQTLFDSLMQEYFG